MIRKLEHIGVMVTDMDASIRFYTEVLRLQLVKRVQLRPGVELTFLSYQGQESVELELITGDGSHAEQGKVNHIAFTVTDIEAEVERLKSLGVKLIDEQPKTILDGIKIAFFYGPDGERLEFFQPNA